MTARKTSPGLLAALLWAAPLLSAQAPDADRPSRPAPTAASEEQGLPSARDPRTWRAALASQAELRLQLEDGADLVVTGDSARLVAELRLAGPVAVRGLALEFPGTRGFAATGEGHAQLRAKEGGLILVRPGAARDDGQSLEAVRAQWTSDGPGRVQLAFPGYAGKLPVVARFEVVFPSDPEAVKRWDRDGDGRVDLRELMLPVPTEPEGSPSASVAATKTDTLVVDNGTPGQANPGDVIGYEVTLTAQGGTATALAFDDTVDPDTTPVGGSVNVSPLALDDAYSAVGNLALDVDTAASGILGNDREFLGDTFTLASAGPNAGTQTACPTFPCVVATAEGGTLTLKAPGDGRFTYVSPAGLPIPGSDSFAYVVTDGAALTGSGTVTFTLAGRVWFVDRDAPAGGSGTQAAPFNLLATVNGAGGVGDPDGPNDVIYLHDRAAVTDYVGGIELEAGQRLVGSGVPLIVSGTTYLPATTPPVIENTAGNALTLVAGSTVDGRPHVEGLTLNAANNAAIAGAGVAGTLSLDNVAIDTSGSGAGLSLTNQAGTLTFNGSIGGSGTGAAVVLNGGAGSVTLAGAAVNKTAGRLVDVQSKTGGTVTFGALTGTGAATDAVVVQNNTGGTAINFGSGLSVTTTAGRGLFANNGGTISISGTASTISATGGAALDVTATSFGSGATFAAASSTGSPAEGLRLANVGGPVTIDGGAISGSTGTAFSLAQGSANVTYAGTIGKTSAGRAVDVQARAGGGVSFGGAITATGASTGINVSGATAPATVSFTGPVDLGVAGTPLTGGTALTVDHGGTASTTTFANLDVLTTGQEGINASNGGTFNVALGSVDAGRRALNLDGLAVGATFTGVSSSGSASEGLRLNAVTGSLTINSTTVTGPATQGILVQGSSATVDFAAAGTTTVSGGGTQRILVTGSTGNLSFGNTTLSEGTDAVSLQNNSAGTRTFGALSIGGNSGVGFLHALGGGSVNVTGATIITNPGGTGLDIQGAAAGSTLTFNGLSVNKGATAGTGVNLAANAVGPGFGTLVVTTSNGTGLASNNSPIANSGGSIASTNAPAINASATAFSSAFTTVSSTNSASQGINLSGPTGTLSMSAGTISGSAGTAFSVAGGNAVVSYGGTLTVTNGQSGLATSNVTGGSLALGTVNVSGAGAGRDAVVIDGTGNPYDVTITSATLDSSSMRHGLALSDLGAGSDITISAGTITSTGAGRRVVNFAGPTNGTFNLAAVTLNGNNSDGLALASTQLGTYTFGSFSVNAPNGGVGTSVNGTSAAVTFRSVTQAGGNLGLSLTSTTGSFTVTGNGGTCTAATPTCTGGTIGGTTGADGATAGAGVWMSSASNVSLTRMRFHDHANFAIRGQNVTSFTLDNSVVNGANGTSVPSREGSVVFDGLFGTSAVSHSTVSGGIEDNLRVENTTATPLAALNITGTGGTGSSCRILNNSTVSGNVGVRLAGFNNAVMTATISGCLFQGNRTDSINVDASNTATLSTTITNNVVIAGTGGANQGNLGINVTSGLTGAHSYVVTNNLVGTDGGTPAPLLNTGLNLFSGNGSTLGSVTVGSVASNTVRHAGSGSGHGIQAFQDLQSTMRANIDANTVSNVALDFGLRVEAAGDPAGAGGNVQVGLTNNNVSVLSSALDALRVRARRQAVLCSDIRGNTTNAGGTAGGFFGLFTNQSNTATFSVEGLAPGAQSAATTQTYLVGQNPAAATLSATAATNYNGVAVNACSIP